MVLNGFMGQFNNIFVSLMKLAWINTLWLVFTVLGLGIFGWAPATVGMFSVFRRIFYNKEIEFSICKEFFAIYKEKFVQSNVVGIFLIVGTWSFIYGILTLKYLDQTLAILIGAVFLAAFILFGLVALFIFPVLSHYNTSLQISFRYSLMIGLSHLHYSFVIVLALLTTYALFTTFPGLLLFYALSVPVAIVMHFSTIIFRNIERKSIVQ